MTNNESLIFIPNSNGFDKNILEFFINISGGPAHEMLQFDQ